MEQTTVGGLYRRMIASFGVEGLHIPATYVKIYNRDDTVPEELSVYHPEEEMLMSCQAARHASQGHPVLLSVNNIGCVAAAISFGLLDQHQEESLNGPRTYTELMEGRKELGPKFKPPSPRAFTDGLVYACRSVGRDDYCLFGKADSGRFKDVETARKAVAEMMAIQPATTQAVFFYSNNFKDMDLEPDVVVLAVRPVELTRLIQGYQFITGERIKASMGPVRVVDSDLIVRPYLTQEINVSTYCLGARLVAGFEAERLGVGIPMDHFKVIIDGLEASATGYPFRRYPGAVVRS